MNCNSQKTFWIATRASASPLAWATNRRKNVPIQNRDTTTDQRRMNHDSLVSQSSLPDLHKALQILIEQIPAGRVATYGDLAEALGSRSAARWVGEFLLEPAYVEQVKSHRVVRSTGELGLHVSRNTDTKARLLQAEFVEVDSGHVDLERYRFREFVSDRPLARLIAEQASLPERTAIVPFPDTPLRVAGVDISYATGSRAVAAFVLLDVTTGNVEWSTTLIADIHFPYIPGLLTYRESPLMRDVLRTALQGGQTPDVLFVDGNGLLHPRRAGIAVHLGVATELPTIGIGKKLLCGQVDLTDMSGDDCRPITENGETIGAAIKAKDDSRPIFVSPGHRIDVADAVRIARSLLLGHRIPEPVYAADALSRSTARELDHNNPAS
jgi:deoxyribonuclease V